MIIGTAGHIDHGKTTLVKALTGVDTDRLPEEKARGITLDLGYAYTDDGLLGYVDVPGHDRLVHNMIAGATGIDFLLLVIATDDGPMPQTREHLAIAQLLGLERGAVALTKIDGVSPERLAAAQTEISALLDGTPLAGAPLFPVSAPQGEGIAALHAHLAGAAHTLNARRAGGAFRLAIDRVFTLSGIGLVVTGTAHSGRVATGDMLTITPPGLAARVRGLHVQDQPASQGQAGQRIAINLAGTFEKTDLARGMWAVAPSLHSPVQRFHGEIRAIEPLCHWQAVHVHLGAEDITARLALLEGETLEPGNTALAEFLLDRPLGALAHDRYVLRDQSASRTIGGGRVLDIFPPARHKRKAERLDMLRLLADDDSAVALAAVLERQPSGVDLGRYAIARNIDASDALWRSPDMVVIEDGGIRTGFSAANWKKLGERLLAAADAEHARAPDMIGIEHDRLRRLTLPSLNRAVFDRLLGELLQEGRIAQTGGWLHAPGHRAALTATDAEIWQLVEPLLAAAPYNPPRVRDIAHASAIPEESVRSVMKRAARVGLIYPVAYDHYFSAGAVAQLAGHVDALCEAEGCARAAALRDIIGGGRKVAIHILEFFDRIGYTRRIRDNHVRRDPGSTRQWLVQ